jgi:hypothetical protein
MGRQGGADLLGADDHLGFLKKTRDASFGIRQPNAFRHAGYYPTQ